VVESITIVEPTLLELVISSEDVTCHGDENGSASVSASGGTPPYTYLWSNGETTESIVGLSAGTYTVTVTDANGCEISDGVTIVEPEPLLVSIADLDDVCADVPAFELIGSPAGGTYSGPGVSGNMFDPVAAGPGTHEVVYDYSDANGCSGSASTTITVYELPIVSLADFGDVCADSDPFALTGGLPEGGTYSGPGVSADTFDPIAAGLGTHTITYTYTDANGCTSAATAEITVVDVPVVDMPTLDNVCEDAPAFALTGASPAGGTWSGPGVSGGTFDPAVAGTGTHTLTYTYADQSGCDGFGTTTITVVPLPLVTLPDFGGVCADAGPVSLTGGMPAGGTYSGPGVSGNVFDPQITGEGTFTITYQYTDGDGCAGEATATITVHPLPVVTCPADLSINLEAGSAHPDRGNTCRRHLVRHRGHWWGISIRQLRESGYMRSPTPIQTAMVASASAHSILRLQIRNSPLTSRQHRILMPQSDRPSLTPWW
jgi:hypothetical protein